MRSRYGGGETDLLRISPPTVAEERLMEVEGENWEAEVRFTEAGAQVSCKTVARPSYPRNAAAPGDGRREEADIMREGCASRAGKVRYCCCW